MISLEHYTIIISKHSAISSDFLICIFIAMFSCQPTSDLFSLTDKRQMLFLLCVFLVCLYFRKQHEGDLFICKLST